MIDVGDGERIVTLVHDLRTPLTIVQGFADLLARRSDSLTDVQREEYVTRIAAAAEEMKAILDDERSRRLTADEQTHRGA
jgi:signal transduction histidine kinase